MDELLSSAVAHWGPRFAVNGVTVADFARVTSGIESWSAWCAAWVAVGAEHEDLGRTALAEGRFTSAKEELRSTEETFLARGMATLCLDGPGQGEAEYDFPIRADWSAVAELIWDVVGAEPALDESRLGIWGVSLGGYYSPRVAAALGDRATACVSLAGPFNFGECWDGLPQLTRDTFRVRAGASTDAEAREIALTLDLGAVAKDLVAPLLIVFGRQDRLIPWEHSTRLHDAVSGPVEVLMIEQGNHGCANVAPWHRPRTADWLAARLSAPASTPDSQHTLPTAKAGS